MTVCTEDQLSGTHMVLHHDLMADTLTFIEGDSVFLCEIPHLLLGGSRPGAVCGDVVVHDPDKLIHICHAGMLQLVVVHVNGQVGGAVIA